MDPREIANQMPDDGFEAEVPFSGPRGKHVGCDHEWDGHCSAEDGPGDPSMMNVVLFCKKCEMTWSGLKGTTGLVDPKTGNTIRQN